MAYRDGILYYLTALALWKARPIYEPYLHGKFSNQRWPYSPLLLFITAWPSSFQVRPAYSLMVISASPSLSLSLKRIFILIPSPDKKALNLWPRASIHTHLTKDNREMPWGNLLPSTLSPANASLEPVERSLHHFLFRFLYFLIEELDWVFPQEPTYRSIQRAIPLPPEKTVTRRPYPLPFQQGLFSISPFAITL